MKPLSLFLILVLSASAIAQPVEPVKPKTPIAPLVPLAMTAKGGELIVIDAGKAAANVLFDFDTAIFDAKHAVIDGKKLYLAMPKNDATKTYAITVITDMPLNKDRVTITVAGDAVVPPTPPADPLAKLKADVAAILANQAAMQATITQNTKDIAALQGGGPVTPPVTPPSTKPATSLTFVVLSPNQTTATVTEDAAFRAWLKTNNIGVFGITTQAQIDANPRFKNVAAPCIVLQDSTGAVVATTPLPATVALAQAFVTKYK